MMSDIVAIVDSLNELTKAVKTQDNHVLSDLDTYRIESVLSECLVEFRGIHKELSLIREAIKDGYCR
jgi:hypothetical protein